MKPILCVVALAAALACAAAQAATPAGLWKTIDDDGKTEKSLVRITEAAGTLSGKVEKIFDPKKQDSVCEDCKDERRGQPVLGMTILRNVRQDADDPALWSGGEILDPNNGKTYRTRLKPVDDGKRLEMRGYLGPFYRTQTWVRVE